MARVYAKDLCVKHYMRALRDDGDISNLPCGESSPKPAKSVDKFSRSNPGRVLSQPMVGFVYTDAH
jgi:hypothetical protein